MSYVYDIVLNYQEYLYDFYEWNRDDNIYHIKRINLILVNSKVYNDIYDNIVSFNSDFLISIYNKCEYYTNRKINNIPYAFLLTDSYRVMGLLLDNSGEVIKYSSLLIDEEEEILDLCHKLGEISLEYQIIKKRDKKSLLTRKEIDIIQYIENDLMANYEQRNINKLKYLYYEYFNKQSDDIYLIYEELLKELRKSFSKKHYDLYNLIKLSYSGKNVKNWQKGEFMVKYIAITEEVGLCFMI